MDFKNLKNKFSDAFERLVFAVITILFLCAMVWTVFKIVIGIPSSIINSDTYLWLFNNEKYEQKKLEKAERKAQFFELRMRECKILVQAKKDIIPIEIQRGLLRGYTEEKALKYAYRDIEKDEKRCNKNGILPYKENED